MLGQKKLLRWVDNNINSFPHFIVLIGSSGCGKKTLAREIAHKISCVYSECSVNVDAVREVIDSSYQSQTKVMYCFADADNMKAQAKNAMLKITEEPPQNAYFCLTVCDESSLLDTIKSRAYVLQMEEYEPKEISDYVENKYEVSNELYPLLCKTPGDADLLHTYEPESFYEYVELVVDNVAEVEPANAFKSAGKLALKSDEGYDLKLFWRAFVQVCLERMEKGPESVIHYCNGIIATTKCLNKVSKLGVNKQQLYDKWVFDIREVWVNE